MSTPAAATAALQASLVVAASTGAVSLAVEASTGECQGEIPPQGCSQANRREKQTEKEDFPPVEQQAEELAQCEELAERA